MKISPAALPILILAVAIGPPAHASLLQRSRARGIHHPSDCCFSYTPRNIRCAFMESYYRTSGGCSQPGIIFTTKRGHKFCANPQSKSVQQCVDMLDSANTENTEG